MNFNTVYCGDVIATIKKNIDVESVDLVVTSPPYDNLREYMGFEFDFNKTIEELYRVMKPGGVVVWVVGDAYINGSRSLTSFEQALQFKKVGFNIHDVMIYRKTGFNYPSQGRYNQIYEFMIIASKGLPKTFNPIYDVPKKWGGSWGKTNTRKKDGTLHEKNIGTEGMAKTGRADVVECPNCGNIFLKDSEKDYGYARRGNIWTYRNSPKFAHKDTIVIEHPATFPLSLAEDHILSWSNEDDVILDPLCGSGTTLVAAMLLKRKYIGIDVSEKYCDISRKRIVFYKERM